MEALSRKMPVVRIEINTKTKQLQSQYWSKVKVTSYSTFYCIVQQLSFIISQAFEDSIGGGGGGSNQPLPNF